MICPNCKNENMEGASFCTSCGTNLANPTANVNAAPVNKANNNQQQQKTVTKENVKASLTDTFKYVVDVIKTPVAAYKAKEETYSDGKNVCILTGTIVGFLTVFNLITTILSSMFVKTFDYSTMKTKTTFNIEGLKSINYIELILQYFLGIIIGIVVLATVYYAVSFLFKKKANFIKMTAIAATSAIPTAIGCMILPVILSKVWLPLAVASTIIGGCYSFLVLYNLVETQFEFDNQDTKIYYYLTCMSSIGIGTTLVVYKIVTSAISSSLGNLTNILG